MFDLVQGRLDRCDDHAQRAVEVDLLGDRPLMDHQPSMARQEAAIDRERRHEGGARRIDRDLAEEQDLAPVMILEQADVVGHRPRDFGVSAERRHRDDQRTLRRTRFELLAEARIHELINRPRQADVRIGEQRIAGSFHARPNRRATMLFRPRFELARLEQADRGPSDRFRRHRRHALVQHPQPALRT